MLLVLPTAQWVQTLSEVALEYSRKKEKVFIPSNVSQSRISMQLHKGFGPIMEDRLMLVRTLMPCILDMALRGLRALKVLMVLKA